jgi:hypothetical protein
MKSIIYSVKLPILLSFASIFFQCCHFSQDGADSINTELINSRSNYVIPTNKNTPILKYNEAPKNYNLFYIDDDGYYNDYNYRNHKVNNIYELNEAGIISYDSKNTVYKDYWIGMTRNEFDSITNYHIEANELSISKFNNIVIDIFDFDSVRILPTFSDDRLFSILLEFSTKRNNKEYPQLVSDFRDDAILLISHYENKYGSYTYRYGKNKTIRLGLPTTIPKNETPTEQFLRMESYRRGLDGMVLGYKTVFESFFWTTDKSIIRAFLLCEYFNKYNYETDRYYEYCTDIITFSILYTDSNNYSLIHDREMQIINQINEHARKKSEELKEKHSKKHSIDNI